MSFFSSLFDNKLEYQAQVKHDLARLHLKKGEVEKALALLEEAEQIDPEHEDLIKLRAEINAALPMMEEGDVRKPYEDPYVVFFSEEFDIDSVQGYTDNGYSIQAAAYGEGQWHFVLRHRQEGEIPQNYSLTPEFTAESFDDYIKEDYYPRCVASDGVNWFLVFDEVLELDDMAWIFDPSQFPTENLKQWEQEEAQLYHLVESEGQYFAAAVMPNYLEDYLLERFEEFPEDRISEIWEEDRWVSLLAYAKGYYWLASGKDPDWADQGYMYRNEFPAEDILQKMYDGYEIQQLYFADDMWHIFYGAKKA